MPRVLAPPRFADQLVASALQVAQIQFEAADAETTALTARYQFDPEGYIRDKLGWEPWRGTSEAPGQCDVIDAYTLALRQQEERLAWEAGTADAADLHYWQPGMVIRNRIRFEAGHNVGKTKLASGLVNHFFDTCVPSIIYTFATGWVQIHDLLWKEIKVDRRGKGLPGRILDLELQRSDNHFVKGRATDNAGGSGTERAQGQHNKYLMFVVDEAEGVPDFIFDAIDAMASGGIVIILYLANPKTRTSRFYKLHEHPQVVNFRISCVNHPNVLANREIVPTAVRRDYVDGMITDHCKVVPQHDPDQLTFTVPWQPGVIYAPDAEMCFRVLGIAPSDTADNTLVPVGRYEAATKRAAESELPTHARMGVDVARFGHDMGTLYIRHDGRAWRAAQFAKLDTFEYARVIKAEAAKLKAQGVRNLAVRIDGGGGFGGGVIDQLSHDREFLALFPEPLSLLEVHFNGVPYSLEAYADLVTELYAQAAEMLTRLAVSDPPNELQDDLCQRQYGWVTTRGRAVKRLEPKDEIKKRLHRSPDDGDGFVLAVAPDYAFPTQAPVELVTYDEPVRISAY